MVLAQEVVYEKTNEIPVFQEMLAYLDVEGKTVTADAMHCQRETCRRIIRCKGNYLFGLKENQPSLLEDIRVFFKDANEKELDRFQTLEKNAGRIEERICLKIKDISWLKEHKWPGLRSVFSIERIIETCGKSSRETSFYISSCNHSPEHLMALAREHWKIESLHWLLDVTFSEDDCRFLSENAHRTMSALRKFALAVHKNFLAVHHKTASIKAHMLSITISLVGTLGSRPGVSTVSRQSYNKGSNGLTNPFLGLDVRRADCQPSSCCGVRFGQVEPRVRVTQ